MKNYLKILLTILGAVAIFGCIASPALAYTYAAAQYYGYITISSNSTGSLTNVSANFSANTTAMIAMGLLNSTATNCAVVDSGGSYVPFMPGYPGNPWIVYAGNMNPMQTLNDTLYTGNNTSGKLAIFGTLEVPNSTSLNVTTNGTLGMTALIGNTSGNLISKPGAYQVDYNSTTGNTTANILSGNTSITSYTNDTDDGLAVYGLRYAYQTTANISGSPYLYQIAMRMYRGGNPGNVSVNVSLAGGTNPKPIGGTLVSATKNLATISAASPGEWVIFSITTPYQLTNGQSYGVTLSAPSGDAANYVVVRQNNAGAYANGMAGSTTDGGVTWTVSPAIDLVFYLTAPISVSQATTQAEHAVTSGVNSPFNGLNIDGSLTLPVSQNIVMNSPLFQAEDATSPFTSIDTNAITETVTGATHGTTGYTFTNAGDRIDNGITALLQATTFSADIWFTPTTVDATTRYIWDDVRLSGGANNYGWYIRYSNTGLSAATANTTAGDVQVTYSPITAGVTYHVVFTYNDTTKLECLYVNGNLVDSDSAHGYSISTLHNYFGVYANDTGGAAHFAGVIHEAKYYNTDLSLALVQENYNADRYKFTGSGTNNNIYSKVVSIPVNSNNITFSSLTYIISANITKGGNLGGSWAWNYGATITDLSGNGNTAGFTPRTTSSSPYVTATLSTFLPVNQAQASVSGLPAGIQPWTTAPPKPDSFLSPTGPIKVPIIGTFMNQILQTTANQTLFWYVMSFVVIWFGGFLAMRYTHSIVVKAVVMFVLMLGGSLSNVYGAWTLIVFTCYAFGILVMSRHYGF